MSVNTKCADFKGEDFFVGIDTHKSNWKVTVRTRDVELKTFSADPSPEGLYNYMKRNYPNGTYRSVYEAGFCGYWIHRKLTSYNFNSAAEVQWT
jgi:transposase